MACFSPITGYKGPGGLVKFSHVGAYVDKQITIACGQCIGCRLAKSYAWSTRMMHEAQMHDRNSFITLTYDEENLPKDGSLNVKHWQDFAKRARKQLGPFRFYHCGEYGDQNGRPHYHAILFGQDFSSDRKIYNETNGKRNYTSATLDQIWGKGITMISGVTADSTRYVAGYVMKRVTGQAAPWHYSRIDETTGEVIDLKPEYATMSRNPGLGKTWFDKFHKDVYPSDEVIRNGYPMQPPKYYDQLMEIKDPDYMVKLRQKRADNSQKFAHNNTYERHKVREEVNRAKLAQSKRNV